jgi:putative FmdB family regulatory protein
MEWRWSIPDGATSDIRILGEEEEGLVPLYEYECGSCGSRFERRQRVTDEPVQVCPNCGGPCRRVIHPVGIIFKGSGWYVTDSRKGVSATTSSDAKDSSGATETKTESKAAESPATNGAAEKSASSSETTKTSSETSKPSSSN